MDHHSLRNQLVFAIGLVGPPTEPGGKGIRPLRRVDMIQIRGTGAGDPLAFEVLVRRALKDAVQAPVE
jgi:hypothetical protein